MPTYAYVAAHLHGGNPGWIRALFDGTHGRPVAETSLVTATPDGRPTAAIIVIEGAPGNERAAEAFIAELFTHPNHRRQGLAEELLRQCMHALHPMGRTTVTVTVDRDTDGATTDQAPRTPTYPGLPAGKAVLDDSLDRACEALRGPRQGARTRAWRRYRGHLAAGTPPVFRRGAAGRRPPVAGYPAGSAPAAPGAAACPARPDR